MGTQQGISILDHGHPVAILPSIDLGAVVDKLMLIIGSTNLRVRHVVHIKEVRQRTPGS